MATKVAFLAPKQPGIKPWSSSLPIQVAKRIWRDLRLALKMATPTSVASNATRRSASLQACPPAPTLPTASFAPELGRAPPQRLVGSS